jgi:hypothetical protein
MYLSHCSDFCEARFVKPRHNKAISERLRLNQCLVADSINNRRRFGSSHMCLNIQCASLFLLPTYMCEIPQNRTLKLTACCTRRQNPTVLILFSLCVAFVRIKSRHISHNYRRRKMFLHVFCFMHYENIHLFFYVHFVSAVFVLWDSTMFFYGKQVAWSTQLNT